MNFRCKFWHNRSILRPSLSHGVRNFGDLTTYSIDFCILYAESLPYFYFRFVWPTDLKSMLQVATLTAIISNKFEVDTTIYCWVIAYLLLIHSMTVWASALTFWPWTFDLSSAGWDVLPVTCWPNLKFLTAPITKIWKVVQNGEIWVVWAVRGHSRSYIHTYIHIYIAPEISNQQCHHSIERTQLSTRLW